MSSETLPSGWTKRKLGEVCRVVSGGTPSRNNPSYWENGTIPWVTPTDITNGNARILTSTKDSITPLGLQGSAATLLPMGTLLMTSRATVGEIKIAGIPVCTNQGFKSLVPNEWIEPWYLYYEMNYNRERYASFGRGSTFLEVSKVDTENFEINYPPLPEQRIIAAILTTIDTAIEQTEALIQKQQRIKQGLVQDLLTRGVDENGELRPTYNEDHSLYVDSNFGRMPKQWEFSEIENKIQQVIDYRGKTPRKASDGTPLITAKNVRDGYLDPEPREYIYSEEYKNWMNRGIPNEGDVFFTTEAPLGNVARVPDYKLAVGQRIITLQPKPDELNAGYLFWLLLMPTSKRRILQKSTGSTVVGIKSSVFQKIPFHFPKLREQEVIAQVLDTTQRVIENENRELEKLKILKQGLMQDLLNGRIRVPNDFQSDL